jgi:ABC-type antimicrobial peptide transport system permease subunit
VLAGLVLGVVAAALLTQLMTSVLYGVPPTDALTFATVVFVLLAVAAAACLLPARRATGINPMIALRAT